MAILSTTCRSLIIKIFRKCSAIAMFVTIVSFFGCATTPSLLLSPGSTAGPTVGDLVDHLACELGKSYEESQKKGGEKATRWHQLIENNFVASVELTLMVTRNEGFNPSFSWITPLTGAGNVISPIIDNGVGTQTQATFNRTLSLGLQLNGSQDYKVVQNYMIDMRNLVLQYRKYGEKLDPESDFINKLEQNKVNLSSFPYCLPRGGERKPNYASLSSPLKGNMELDETIDDGLIAIERSKNYNIYGTSGPTSYDDVEFPEINAKMASQPAFIEGQTLSLMKVDDKSKGNGGGALSGGGTTGGNPTMFGSVIDFYITMGISGGPSITTLKEKIGRASCRERV